MVANGQFVGGDVSIRDTYDAGITFDGESDLALAGLYASPFLVNSDDADMLEVDAVGFPPIIVSLSSQALRFTCGLYLMTRHDFSAIIGEGFQSARLVDDAVPTYLVALLGVGNEVLLPAEALAVEPQFYLIGVGEGDK